MWKLRLLGDLTVSKGGVEYRRFRALKYGHLLAYLSTYPNEAHSRDRLVDLFWPDEDIVAGKTCLRTALSSLRRQLGQEIFLVGSRDSIRINSDEIETDVAEFERLARQNSSHAKPLYAGVFLPACYDDWAQTERLRLQSLFDTLSEAPPEKRPKEAKPEPKRYLLPRPLTPFSGRKKEIEFVVQALVEDGNRLVTLCGLGGAGKTRMSLEIARHIRDEAQIPAYFVDLSDILTVANITGRLGDVLGLSRIPADSLFLRIVQHIGDETTLLVLDNFEQLVGDESAKFLLKLTHACPSLQLLITSRVPTQVVGELVYPIPPLDPQAAANLFLDRARRILPDFPESEHLHTICRRLDNHPLSIELCAARAKTLTAKNMLAGLEDRFSLLKARQFFMAQRHQSLDTVLDLSCPPDGQERDALIQLSICRGGWTKQAAEELIGPEAEPILEYLLHRCLILVEQVGDDLRYRMLETVRDFVHAESGPERRQEFNQKHSHYYGSLGSHLCLKHGSAPHEAFRELEVEHANIYSAIQWGIGQSAADLEASIRTLYDLNWCWWVRGFESDFNVLIGSAAIRVEDTLPLSTRALLQFFAAEQANLRGDRTEALKWYDLAVPNLREAQEFGIIGQATIRCANTCIALGQLEKAEAYLRQGLDSATEETDSYYIWLASLSNLYMNHMAREEEGELFLLQMRGYWTKRADGVGHLAMIERALAACAWKRNEFVHVEERLRWCIQTFRQLGERQRESETLRSLGLFLAERKREAESLEAFREADLIDRSA